jgi:hypothetical protein
VDFIFFSTKVSQIFDGRSSYEQYIKKEIFQKIHFDMTASRDLFIDDSSQKGKSGRSRILFLIGLGALVVGIGNGIGIGWAIRGDSSDTAQEETKLEFDPLEFIDVNTDNNTIQGELRARKFRELKT